MLEQVKINMSSMLIANWWAKEQVLIDMLTQMLLSTAYNMLNATLRH